ncbi:MAG: TolC family protein [Paludibacteraceae bacterium]|nr:TolC family protein [Paludibacteraceae bacterium]
MKKRLLLVAMLCLTASSVWSEQKVYTLEECRELALRNNKEQKIAREEVEKATYERKAARTKYFPDLNLRGAYVRSGDQLSLVSEDMYLPIGTLLNGSFGFELPTLQADGTIASRQLNNKWTFYNGSVVPLDKEGKPFDPRKNPEKLQWKEYTIIPKDELEFDTRNIFLASLNLTQPVFMGGKIVAYNKITELKKELAQSKLRTLNEDVILEVDGAYWQIISLNNKRKAVEALVALLEKMQKDVDALIESGVATKADELSVSVKKNEAEMTLFKVDNGIRLSKMLLAQYCGLPLEEEYSLVDETNDEIAIADPELYDINEVYSNRSEVKSLHIAKSIYDQKVKVERAALMPNVALFGSYAGTNPSTKHGFEKEFGFDWHVGVLVNVPLLHWGENIYTMKAAKCEANIAQYKEDEAKEKIELQVSQSSFKQSEAIRKWEVSKRNLERAEENLRYATLGFKEGVIPASNLLEAQTAWLAAHSDKIDAEIEAKMSEINYQKAVGKIGK